MREEPLKYETTSQHLQRIATIIANPVAGGFPRRSSRLDNILSLLRHQGWDVDLWLTQAAGHGQELARKAVAQGANLVIAAGGDGTINEVIQGIAGTNAALGILPFGSANIWAREMGIPLDDLRACDVLLNGQKRCIDLGQVNGRYFFLMAGIGFDAEIAHAIEKKSPKRFGILSYVLYSLWMNFKYSNFEAEISIDGHIIKESAFLIIVGNTQLHSGIFKFTWRAKCDDGQLDICVVRASNFPSRLKALGDFMLQRDERRLWLHYATGASIRIQTNHPIAIQLDGEPAGYTYKPTTFSVIPNALQVVVSRKVQEDLFINK